MNAFITGSHAYGKPTKNSDVDLVILADAYTIDRLRKLSEEECPPTQGSRKPIRFGNLNIIACGDELEFSVWYLGTSAMKMKLRRYNKKQAKKRLDKLRALVGLLDRRDSGD